MTGKIAKARYCERYLAYAEHLGLHPDEVFDADGSNAPYFSWITKKLREWCELTKTQKETMSRKQHSEFDKWVLKNVD